MAVLPTKQVQQATANARPIADYIATEVGVPVAVEVPGGYGEVVSGLRSNAVDVAWVSALAYVAIRNAAAVEPVTRASSYQSEIVCGPGSGVGPLKDGGDWSALKGKHFGFGDRLSLAASLWPRYYMERNRVDPAKDLAAPVTVPSETAVALAVYNGTAACGAIAPEARTAAQSAAPDILAKTQVAFTAPQPVPGDPQLVRSGLNAGQKAKLRAALLKLGHDPAMAGALGSLVRGGPLVAAADGDYDAVRSVTGKVDPGVTATVVAAPATQAPAG